MRQKMNDAASRLLTASLMVWAAAGCGGDESGDGQEKLDSAATESVMCAGKLCTESVTIEEYAVTYGPCCDEDSDNICGAALDDGCEGLDQPGKETVDCPESVSSIGTMLKGCCRPEGRCGVLSQVGFGCVERSDLNETAGGPLATLECTP